jgi:SAM-dependent methyltransferase
MEANQTLALSLEGVEYPAGFYHEQAPVHLGYVCALNGIRGPSVADGFTYCELACGAGETTCILVAANPGGHCIGIDLSSVHIARASELAQAGRVGNARFIQADILSLDVRSLPDLDFVTLHGLYSWVSPEVRAAIHDFIAQKLKPGGVVYISYNAMPGGAGQARCVASLWRRQRASQERLRREPPRCSKSSRICAPNVRPSLPKTPRPQAW